MKTPYHFGQEIRTGVGVSLVTNLPHPEKIAAYQDDGTISGDMLVLAGTQLANVFACPGYIFVVTVAKTELGACMVRCRLHARKVESPARRRRGKSRRTKRGKSK